MITSEVLKLLSFKEKTAKTQKMPKCTKKHSFVSDFFFPIPVLSLKKPLTNEVH